MSEVGFIDLLPAIEITYHGELWSISGRGCFFWRCFKEVVLCSVLNPIKKHRDLYDWISNKSYLVSGQNKARQSHGWLKSSNHSLLGRIRGCLVIFVFWTTLFFSEHKLDYRRSFLMLFVCFILIYQSHRVVLSGVGVLQSYFKDNYCLMPET